MAGNRNAGVCTCTQNAQGLDLLLGMISILELPSFAIQEAMELCRVGKEEFGESVTSRGRSSANHVCLKWRLY